MQHRKLRTRVLLWLPYLSARYPKFPVFCLFVFQFASTSIRVILNLLFVLLVWSHCAVLPSHSQLTLLSELSCLVFYVSLFVCWTIRLPMWKLNNGCFSQSERSVLLVYLTKLRGRDVSAEEGGQSVDSGRLYWGEREQECLEATRERREKNANSTEFIKMCVV